MNREGLWIIDQHVAHERVLFEKVLKQRAAQKLRASACSCRSCSNSLLPQQAVFTEISDELQSQRLRGRTIWRAQHRRKVAPAGIEASPSRTHAARIARSIVARRAVTESGKDSHRIAASIACHAAIKVNMPLEQNKMEWLLAELAKTEYPMSCPHGRPVVLRYSVKDIQKAFKRI